METEKKITKSKKATKSGGVKLKITLVKGINGSLEKHKRTIEALGLKKIGQTVEHTDSPAIRGMIFVVQHLVAVN